MFLNFFFVFFLIIPFISCYNIISNYHFLFICLPSKIKSGNDLLLCFFYGFSKKKI